MKNYAAEDITAALKETGFSKVKTDHHKNKPWFTIFAIHDIFSAGEYGDMHAFVKKLKETGFEKVDLIDTTNGKWIRKSEAGWMGLSGSALLTGIE